MDHCGILSVVAKVIPVKNVKLEKQLSLWNEELKKLQSEDGKQDSEGAPSADIIASVNLLRSIQPDVLKALDPGSRICDEYSINLKLFYK